MYAHNYIPLIFDKNAKSMHWRRDSIFKKHCWESRISLKSKLRTISITLHKSCLQMNRGPQYKISNDKGERRKIGRVLHDTSVGKLVSWESLGCGTGFGNSI